MFAQYIYTDLEFNKPFFLTYVSNSLFVLLFPCQYGLERLQAKGSCVGPRTQPSPGKAALMLVRRLGLQKLLVITYCNNVMREKDWRCRA